MEHIPGYDEWKTSFDEPVPIEECDMCGAELHEGDVVYDINGERWCEECLNDHFRRVL